MTLSPTINARDSIGTKLLKKVFFIYLLFAVVVTGIHIYMEYNRVKNEVIGELSALYATLGKPLAIAVWDADKEQITSLLEGLAASNLVTGASITEIEGGRVRTNGQVIGQASRQTIDNFGLRLESDGGSSKLFGYQYPLRYSETDTGTENLLGHINIFSSELIVFNKLKHQLLYIIISAIIKACVLWVVFLWYCKRLLTKPLSGLAARASEITLDNLQPIPHPLPGDTRSELSVLKDSFNEMVSKLSSGVKKQKELYDRLDAYKEDLEETVNIRTKELQKTNLDLSTQIKERQVAEDRASQYGRILEHSLNEVYVFDSKSLEFLLVNEGARRNLGYSWLEFEQFTPLDINPEYTKTSFEEMLAPLRRGDLDSLVLETSHQRKDSSFYNVEIHLQLMKFPEMEVFVAIALDISEKKLLEDRLRQSHKMEAVGTIAGGIAHDFNNILSVIIGNAELALEECPPKTSLEESLVDIKSASIRARDVISQLLSFSRKEKTIQKPIELKPVIEESIRFMRSTLPKSIQIHLNIDKTPGFVIADSTQIYQLLLNTCTNGAHALDDKAGDLWVNVRQIATLQTLKTVNGAIEPGEYIQIVVEDNGCGISEQDQNRMFDPYFTTKAVGKGSGMGLAVVHGIVTGCNGGITVKSQVGSGTLITIYLPSCEPLMEVEKETSEQETLRGTETILLVDDEDAIIKVGARILESYGYEVITFTDPFEVVSYFQSTPAAIDLVITDMTMPKLNGLQLSEQILSMVPEIPIILCSGYNESIETQAVNDGPIKRFIQKPFRRTELAKTIKQVLQECVS